MFGILIWAAIIGYVCYLWEVYSYWRRRGVCGPTPLPLVGNYGSVFFQNFNELELTHKIYEEYPNEKVVGIFRGLKPVLLVRDPHLFKYFLVKDTKYFRRFNIVAQYDTTQARSTEVLKIMYQRRIHDKFISHLQSTAIKEYLNRVDELAEKKTKFNAKTLLRKFLLEATRVLIIGKERNSFEVDTDYEKVVTCINDIMLSRTRMGSILGSYPSLNSMFTKFSHIFIMFKKLTSIMTNLLNENKQVGEDPTTIMDHLLQLQGKEFTSKLTGNILEFDYKFIVQFSVILAFAGVVPMASILSYMYYELAINQAMQNKVYEEVSKVLKKYNGNLSLNALFEMKYSEMVMRETIRLYLSEIYLHRQCLGRYNIPGTEVTIDEKTAVYLLNNCVKKDKKCFTNPEVFDPERFSPTNKQKIPHLAYVPFGAGPHICTGN